MNSEKCQFCGKPATVHMTQIINSETTVVHMCSECAAKRGLLDQEGLPFAMLSNLSEALFAGIKQQMPLNGLICSECGCTPMSFKETGRLTYRLFSKLYQHYKNNFDLEMQMKTKNVTYSELFKRQQQEDEWF